MQRKWQATIGFLGLGILLMGLNWPLAAQSPDSRGGDALAQIEKRLEKIEKMLAQQQREVRLAPLPRGVWQRIEGHVDKDAYIVILNTETGRVRFLDVKNANVYEK